VAPPNSPYGPWRRNIQVAGGVILIAIGVRILLEHTLGP
jgi:hypothetical protein